LPVVLTDPDKNKKPARNTEEKSFVEHMPDSNQLRMTLKGGYTSRKQ